jgi:hypothetical protein
MTGWSPLCPATLHYASRLAPLMNARNAVPALAAADGARHGFSAKRPLPDGAAIIFRPSPRLRERVG